MNSSTLRVVLVSGALFAIAACDEHKSPTGPTVVGTPTTPTTSSAPGTPPPGMFRLQGFVLSTTGSPLTEARVHVTTGGGELNVLTDQHGGYLVFAAGETQLQVEKEGFRPVVKTITVTRDQNYLNVVLSRSDASGLSGNYTLTFAASGSCSLPSAAMLRVYEVGIEERDSALTFAVWGADFVSWAAMPGFTGTRSGNAVAMQIVNDAFGEFTLEERIPSVGDLGFAGTALGTITGRSITATFRGVLSINPWFLQGGQRAECNADDHRMTFVKTGE